MKTILMLGCSTKAGAYTTQQFYKAGYRVIVYDWKRLPNRHSRFVHRYINVASPEKDLLKFEEQFLAFLKSEELNFIMPLHDAALEIVRHLQQRLPPSIQLLGLNADENYRFAHNKHELMKLAQGFGISTPATIYVDKLGDAENIKVNFPCIVKPICSALIKENRLYTFKVEKVNTVEELRDKIRELILNVPVMIQELVRGFGLGYNFISENGVVYNAYVHKRITEIEGVSSYREVIPEEQYFQNATIRGLVKAMAWNGVGMLEFKVQDGVPFLMEFNGRFFGSVELGVRAGVNLPRQFVELYMEGKIPTTSIRPLIPCRVRNLHDELQWYGFGLLKGRLKSFLIWAKCVLQSLFKKEEHIEDNLFTDPGFVLALYTGIFHRWWDKFVRICRKQVIQRKILKKVDLPGIGKKIAFVCLGNICRSPFAEEYAKANYSQYNFYSYGTYSTENRLSPWNAIIAAKQFGINIEQHHSRYLNEMSRKEMDLFVVMDDRNYIELINLEVPKSKIRFLRNTEIKDPYTGDLNRFITCYAEIKLALDIFFKTAI